MPQITAEEMLTYSPLNTGGDIEVPKYERKLGNRVEAILTHKPRTVIAIDGLRRVGKSTLIQQALLKARKRGRTVYYFSFDKKAHQNPKTLEAVIRFFTQKDAGALIALDEVGRIEDWAGIVKKYYDQNKCAFMLTSSASLKVKKGVESLAGRLFDLTLPPMGFDEYLALKGVEIQGKTLNLQRPDAPVRHREELDGFLLKGAYPELAGIEDQSIIHEYIRNSTIEKMIFDDIPSVFPVRHPAKLLEIFEYFAHHSGGLVQENSISQLLAISSPTVDDYIQYLEQSHLVQRVYTTGNFEKRTRRTKKGYVASPCLHRQFSADFTKGQLFETAVFDKLRPWGPQVYRDEQQREVDFVIQKGRIPIEVKSGQDVTRADLTGLCYYMDRHKAGRGYAIYDGPYNQLEVGGKQVYLIPLSSFLAAGEIKAGPD